MPSLLRIAMIATLAMATIAPTAVAAAAGSHTSSAAAYPTYCVVRELPNGQTTEVCVPYPL